MKDKKEATPLPELDRYFQPETAETDRFIEIGVLPREEKAHCIGFIFKPTHNEIYFLKKGANGDLRHRYDRNFTTDIKKAAIGTSEEKGKAAIVKLVAKFSLDDEYTFTPVLFDVERQTFKRFIGGVWRNEFITPVNIPD